MSGNRSTAQAAISELQKIESMASQAYRPATWLNLASAACYALFIFGYTYSPTFASIAGLLSTAGFISFLILFFIYCGQLKKNGLKIRYIPRTLSGKTLVLVVMFIYPTLIIGGRVLLENHVYWAPFVAALLGGGLIFFSYYKFPAGEWIKDENSL